MHSHGHDHHHHISGKNVLIIALALALVFATLEAFAGWFSSSLALLSDAGHMFSDALALALAAVAAWISRKPPSQLHTYGLGRAEIIGAWISSLLVLVVAIFVIVESIRRFHHPTPVMGGVVMIVASAGILINLLMAWILSYGEETLNVRAAILHVMSDLLGSVAALISGAVIYFIHWTLIDPILSIFISILILISSFSLLRESFLVLMEGVPSHIDLTEVGNAMAKVAKVKSVHDLHVWTLSSGTVVLTAHVEINDFRIWHEVLADLRNLLAEKFAISHVTLQPETHTFTLTHMPNRPSITTKEVK